MTKCFELHFQSGAQKTPHWKGTIYKQIEHCEKTAELFKFTRTPNNWTLFFCTWRRMCFNQNVLECVVCNVFNTNSSFEFSIYLCICLIFNSFMWFLLNIFALPLNFWKGTTIKFNANKTLYLYMKKNVFQPKRTFCAMFLIQKWFEFSI